MHENIHNLKFKSVNRFNISPCQYILNFPYILLPYESVRECKRD